MILYTFYLQHICNNVYSTNAFDYIDVFKQNERFVEEC